MDRFNKRKFILKGSLALEGYFEVYGNNKINLLKEYNEMQNKKKNLLALAEKEKDIQKKVKLSNDAWDMDDDLQVLGNKLKKVDNLKEANAIEINNEIYESLRGVIIDK